MTGNEIRRTFLDFFARHGHRVVRSSSLVPAGDPTLLFTNAGMNQFKDVFLGLEEREYRRATTCQKCVRAGGKHNDLENVGYTNRHHTFFEMLGNFSFGDYFKKDAIALAWQLVTSSGPGGYSIPKDKLYATIFKGEEGIARDSEAFQGWLAQGVPKNRIYEFGVKENFWAMGDTGPCGPCSEIHFDMGPAASESGHTDCAFGCDCGRYVEIWNLVFMQFNRDPGGRMAPLPKPSVDTGAGLERLAAVLQGKISNFDTDLLRPLVDCAAEMSGKSYGDSKESEVSLRILADHSRAAAFLISDGVLPSNEGRGYVLRKIIRRALIHGRKLGLEEPFLFKMTGEVAELMQEPYPELLESMQRVATVVLAEENRFARTVTIGLQKLEEDLEPYIAAKRRSPASASCYPGEKAFRLYDTFGLPLDFIADVARDFGVQMDSAGFERAMAEQRERARASWKGLHKQVANPVYARLAETYRTEPDFYFETTARDCRVEAILTAKGEVQEVPAGVEAEIVLDRTPFYAEAGGQVADVGGLYADDLSEELAEVRGAYYPVAGLIAHRVVTRKPLRVGERIAGVADAARRGRTRRNHTATHVMHAALRNVLGTHVKQAGSLVDPDHLRFDFSHFAPLDPDELNEIEQQVNEEILHNAEVQTDILPLDEALASGALAFFGDKYPEQNVRVVTIPDPAAPRGFFSKELCGGTHVHRTGDIGVFKVVAEQSVAAGVRRIEAITGEQALSQYQQALRTLRALGETLGVTPDQLLAAVERLVQNSKHLEKQIEALKHKATRSKVDDLLTGVRTVKNVRVLSAQVPDVDRQAMRQLADDLRQKMGSGVVVLGTAEDGKVALIAAVTRDLTPQLHAGKIIQAIASKVGGTGGGRADLAEAGGKDTSALQSAIDLVYDVLERML